MNDEFDLQKTLNHIKKIQEQNSKLEYIHKNYIQYAKNLLDLSASLDELSSKIKSIAKDIDPVMNITKKLEKNPLTQEAKEELYESMRTQGTHVTLDLIKSSYPTLNDTTMNNVLQWLKKQNNVKSTKDGQKLRLFI